MSDYLLALGIAAIVPAVGFSIRWIRTPISSQHWSGWAAMITGTFVTFCIALGNLIR